MPIRFVLSAALLLLAGCTSTSQMVSQQANPAYVGKSFKNVMVVAVTADEIVRRTYEDRMVALLAKRGVKGIPSYSAVSKRGKVDEAALRQAVAGSGADAVLITRATRSERTKTNIAGGTIAMGYGGGYYGFYSGYWEAVTIGPQTVVSGPTWTITETRLFDEKTGAVAWTGIMDTKESGDLNAAMTQYIEVVFDAMVHDRVI